MKKLKLLLTLIILLPLLQACKKDLLDVENPNDPDFAKAYSNGEDLQNLTSGLYNTIFQGCHSSAGVAPLLATAADNVSCSWGNFAMRDLSREPRDFAWNNSPSYSNNTQTKYFLDQMYASISTASNILTAINNGVNVGEAGAGNNRVKAFCKFAQGVAYGNLALVFDKAFIVDENIKIENPTLAAASPSAQVAAKALSYLDEAIALSSTSFTIPKEWLGTASDLSNAQFKQLLNTEAARILAYMPRNKTQLAAVDWNKVKAYADAGITSDFTIEMDGTTKWYFEAEDYLTASGWGVTDMYVVNMMDPAVQPKHWDDSANFPYPPASLDPLDERLSTDFEYLASNWFQVARGYYNFSSYRSKRYDQVFIAAIGPKPEVMKAENDMLRAEASAYLGDLSGAAAIINVSTYKTRGQMPDVNPVLDEIVQAIHHERHVEMYTTGMGLQFFEMRKLNLLQKGTPLHLPLPAKLLEVLNETQPFYTFGHVANADGINVSNSGWYQP